ncbi:MAG TPA: O-antigen ligase family protein [Pyrinomonadaceae bacterium]|nr:O-antigen ligase family protein [Pyrinomonadaceae bacterium]
MKKENQDKSQVAKVLDSAIIACLFLFAIAAPNSIAATQTAWLLGMALWLLRFAFYPRPKLNRSPLDYYLLGFFILSGLSCLFSYEPLVSLGKMRAASLFTIVYLFSQNIPSRRVIQLLVLALVSACMINVIFTGAQRLLGSGVKVHNVSEASPLYKAGVRDGDTLLSIEGVKLNDPQELVNELSKPDKKVVTLKAYRHEWILSCKLPRGVLLPGNNALEQLGIGGWSKGRDWRASGFYGNFVTYAEALQLILALAVGLFAALPRKRSLIGLALLVALAGMLGALMLTVTRASWLAFAISTALILLVSVSRRAVLFAGVLAIPLILAGLFVLQQKRNVGFIDQQDQSTSWRETVWREGFHLLVSKPRHLLVGIGMDSIKSHWRAWGLFDKGRLPWGHMHSNLLQIALERGVPALLVWLGLLFIYARTIWRTLRHKATLDWIEHGILLGALGGLVGFFVSGLVHYNWGDSEVIMIFYFVMGLVMALNQKLRSAQQT